MAPADEEDDPYYPSKLSHSKKVAFKVEPEMNYIEKQSKLQIQRKRKMAKLLFERFDGEDVTDGMLTEASQLFSENYGVWGRDAAKSVPFAKPGSRVRLSKDRLRAQYLPNGADCSYVRVTVDGCLAGNAFSCRWTCSGKTICWVTQLVVHRDYRQRGLAVGLLNQLRQDEDDFYGIMSSHPAACLAAAKAFSSGINAIQLDSICKHVEPIMNASPVSYVRDAQLCGSLFHPGDTSGLISSVNTNFFVDHTEPLEALAWVREKLDWPLGDLLDGYEFLLVLEVRRRRRKLTMM